MLGVWYSWEISNGYSQIDAHSGAESAGVGAPLGSGPKLRRYGRAASGAAGKLCLRQRTRGFSDHEGIGDDSIPDNPHNAGIS
jgi:hypothetical protein